VLGERLVGSSDEHERGVRVRLGATAAGCALLFALLAGCAPTSPSRSSTSATGGPARDMRSGPISSGVRRALAARYLVIAEAGNRRLEIDFDGLEELGNRHLAAAEADLRDAAATERLFDRRLIAMTLPPALETIAHTLFGVNESRASLTLRAAASTSPAELARYRPQLDAANGPVERAVRMLRRLLGLPPPDTD